MVIRVAVFLHVGGFRLFLLQERSTYQLPCQMCKDAWMLTQVSREMRDTVMAIGKKERRIFSIRPRSPLMSHPHPKRVPKRKAYGSASALHQSTDGGQSQSASSGSWGRASWGDDWWRGRQWWSGDWWSGHDWLSGDRSQGEAAPGYKPQDGPVVWGTTANGKS